MTMPLDQLTYCIIITIISHQFKLAPSMNVLRFTENKCG